MTGKAPTVLVGTSGWQYDDWRGTVYPADLPTARWFRAYSEWFPTVEVNASFYRLPTEAAVRRWGEQAPPGFVYSAKGSRFTTHNLKIGGDRLPDSVALVTGRLALMGAALGVVLWQLPPQLHRDDERLDRFLGLLPGGTRHAVEFRHASWWAEGPAEVLRSHGAAFVRASGLGMPADAPRTAGFTYTRFHGHGEQAYRYDYADDELAPWAAAIAAAHVDGYAYFNNDVEGHAVRNARTFTAMLAEGRAGAVT